ncbi:esterase family protein [Halalkalibacterium halodurans]|uniref:Enterochelin esterase n=1 Tax=Halalkalibacterium halodurans TaxID=86665 RepID=A0A0M0KL41_ALKHA|nr:esterase family protein [Halalkalibacterium halodurans]MED3648355.1 esterase family protein [Halalkalibacterium halodurans]MED4082854.1 esterase family protein [Halalkalibacterium halodurans]MED4084740.1 esterase family protein [Halalkalibacterium halodurans]MED4106152.1 esterase family protein [Halalkalibacterium halodurans]MED4110655.1 esterase family protein [Halalkalibacterium halodurans]
MVKRFEGKLYEETLTSHYLNDELKLMFYLPPNYTPLYSYDVLIAQDGQDYFQMGRIARQVETLIKDGEIRDVIVVGVPYKDVKQRRKRYHPKGEEMEAYTRFLACELVPYLDETFQTHPLSTGRTLAGDSLAGTVSLLTALQYPTLFGQVMVHSPYVDDTVLQAVRAYERGDTLSIYHRIGTEETNVKTTNGEILDFLTPNRELANLIKTKAFTYDYDEFPGDHTWTYWQKDLAQGLITLFS